MALNQLINNEHSILYTKFENMALDIIEIPTNYKKSENTHTFEIKRVADSINLSYLIFDSKEITSINQFKFWMKDGYIDILFGGAKIIRYDFEILMELKEVAKYKDSYIIFIPWEYTINEHYLIASQWHDTRVNMNIPCANLIDNVKLFCEAIYYESDKRWNLAKQGQEKIIQKITKLINHQWKSDYISQSEYDLHPDGIVKGFFIKADLSNDRKIVN